MLYFEKCLAAMAYGLEEMFASYCKLTKLHYIHI